MTEANEAGFGRPRPERIDSGGKYESEKPPVCDAGTHIFTAAASEAKVKYIIYNQKPFSNDSLVM